MPNPYLVYLINPNFQGVNRLFVLSFENKTDITVHTKCYLPIVEIKDHNVMINGQNFSDLPIKINLRKYDNIPKLVSGEADDYMACCLLHYNYLNKYYKMMAIYLSKQQAVDADPKAVN